MKNQTVSQPSVQITNGTSRFKVPERSLNMNRTILFVVFLVLVLVLSSCEPALQEDGSCVADMVKRVSIDVTDVRPRVVFDQLARELDCDISVSPFLWKYVTLQVEDTPISEVVSLVCQQAGCKYILNGNHLAIKSLTIFDQMRARQWYEFNKMMEDRNRIFQSHLPEGMSFIDVPLSTVLDEISNVSGLTLKPWNDEGDRKVSIDVSGMTVEEALKAVVLYVDGEGAVLIEQKYFLHHSWGQIWLWGNPPSF